MQKTQNLDRELGTHAPQARERPDTVSAPVKQKEEMTVFYKQHRRDWERRTVTRLTAGYMLVYR